jgi:hypothetical protein
MFCKNIEAKFYIQKEPEVGCRFLCFFTAFMNKYYNLHTVVFCTVTQGSLVHCLRSTLLTGMYPETKCCHNSEDNNICLHYRVDLGLCVVSVVFVVSVFNGVREAQICIWIRLFHVARGALCSL